MNRISLALLTIFVLHASAHAADKIKIGYPDASGTFLSLPLGQKAGFFQKEGIQAELIRIRSTVALTALVSGELDYHTVLGPAVAAAIRGVPIKIVAATRLGLPLPSLPCLSSKQSRTSEEKQLG